jgi:hypothetical protein
VKRRLFNLLAAVSLVPLLYCIVVFVRAEYLRFESNQRLFARYGPNVHIHEAYSYRAVLGFPLSIWILGIASSVLPACWLLMYIRNRHRRSLDGSLRCLSCGYDLRASKDRCPECGRAIPDFGELSRAAAADPPQSSPRGNIPA